MSSRTEMRYDPFFSDVDSAPRMVPEPRSRDEHRRRFTTPERYTTNVRRMDMVSNPFAMMKPMMNFMGPPMSQMNSIINDDDMTAPMSRGVIFSSSTITTTNSQNGGQPRIVQQISEQIRGPDGQFIDHVR
jgi:2-phosphoglycerate kinase